MKKKFAAVLLTGSLLFPSATFAAPSQTELNPLLQELGWSQEELENYLVDYYDYTLDEFTDLEEVREFLGPLLTEENLAGLLADYELTLEEATELLITNGELAEGETILDTYIFLDDVDLSLAYYNLTPISPAELDLLLADYELSLEDLEAVLAENGDALENYQYIEDLDWALYTYVYESDEALAEIDDLFSQIGFTEEEMEHLYEHILAIEMENPAFLDELEEISNQMAAFEDFESATELTPVQIAELLALNNQVLDLLQLDVSFSLVKDGEKSSISVETLFAMTTTDGYDLLIDLYNREGQFLADILLTADMLNSELITETGNDLKEAEEIITEKPAAKPEPAREPAPKVIKPEAKPEVARKPAPETEPETELGGKLPDTASDSLMTAAAGTSLALAGLLLYRRFSWRRN